MTKSSLRLGMVTLENYKAIPAETNALLRIQAEELLITTLSKDGAEVLMLLLM